MFNRISSQAIFCFLMPDDVRLPGKSIPLPKFDFQNLAGSGHCSAPPPSLKNNFTDSTESENYRGDLLRSHQQSKTNRPRLFIGIPFNQFGLSSTRVSLPKDD